MTITPPDQGGSTQKDRFRQEPPKKGEYPNNRVFQTAGGHRIEWGEEAGKEYFNIYTPSGSSYSFYPDGTTFSVSVGENVQYNKSGVTITIDENQDIHIKGHSKIQVGGGSHIEVQGDAGVLVGGDVAMATMGNIGLMSKGNMYLGVKGDMNIAVEGSMKTEVKGSSTVLAEGNMTMATKGDMSQSASGDVGVDAGGSLTTKSGGGNYSKGSEVHHNSGSTPATKTTSENYASHSDASKGLDSAGMG